MDILNSLKWRYATKKFDSKKQLTSQQIETLKEAFNLTATSFGLQPIKMLVISNKEIQQKMLEYAYFQQQVVDASHVLVLCIKTDITANDINAYFDLEKKVRGVDEEVISKFRNQLLDMYKNKSLESKQASAKQQAYLALGNLLTVCAVEKIDACPMEGFIPEKIDALFNLKEQHLQSVLLLPVGFRSDDDFMSTMEKVRKPISETTIEIN
ncbi:nitroreductase family protein [Lutibacter sp.]